MPTHQARRNVDGDWVVFSVDDRGAASREGKNFYRDHMFSFPGWRARRFARQLSKPPKKIKTITYTDGRRARQ